MCACPLSTQVYGKYEVRIKLEPGPTKFNALLSGAGQWPPEVDFAEFPAIGDGQARQMFTQTLHYGKANNQIHTSTDADLTTWHTVGVEWSPGLIAYTLDGVVTNSITSHVPTSAMYLAIQTSDHSSPPSTIDSWVDWVHVYEYTGA
jgi:beta-glucanase (GH16 family)